MFQKRGWPKKRRNLFLLYFSVYFVIPTLVVIELLEEISPWSVENNDLIIFILIGTGIYAFIYTLRHWPKGDVEMLQLFLPYVVSLVLAVGISGAEGLKSIFVLHGLINLLGLWLGVSGSVIVRGITDKKKGKRVFRIQNRNYFEYHPFWIVLVIFVYATCILITFLVFYIKNLELSPVYFGLYVLFSIAMIALTHYKYTSSGKMFE
ncbi:MAG: hypothetical protein ABII02_00855 [Candidatus Magasanikbacteria bacterium]